jgi:hypothetical protein
MEKKRIRSAVEEWPINTAYNSTSPKFAPLRSANFGRVVPPVIGKFLKLQEEINYKKCRQEKFIVEKRKFKKRNLKNILRQFRTIKQF